MKKMGMLSRSISFGKKMKKNNIPIIPKLIYRFNRIIFACDIPLETEIHDTVQFSHNGLGVVVNSNAIIGENTLILQNVTIGGNMYKRREYNGKTISAPIIGKNVLIGAGAIVLGPVFIGDGAQIGAGSVVLSDVPSNSVVVGSPAKVVKTLIKEDSIVGV